MNLPDYILAHVKRTRDEVDVRLTSLRKAFPNVPFAGRPEGGGFVIVIENYGGGLSTPVLEQMTNLAAGH